MCSGYFARKSACLFSVSRLAVLLIFQVIAGAQTAAPASVDLSKLPPAVARQIDFAHDIQPILESACLRCHEPEKAKGKLLLDTREHALKGGENGPDILPGASVKSPLIHFVARLVEESEMPPVGKGEPLTGEQVGRLRAWIDQGAKWPAGIVLRPAPEPT